MELSFLLRKPQKGKKRIQNNSILNKIHEIFEHLVVFECNPKTTSKQSALKDSCIYQNILTLIKDVIKSHLSEK